jgi:hypothetical protein
LIQGLAIPAPGVTDPALYYTVSPTGGVITLQPMSSSDPATWALNRFISVSGVEVSGVTLWEGSPGATPLSVFVDIGDGANAPLDPTQLYAYQFTTATGIVDTGPLSPACSITVERDHVSSILYRSLQSGMASLKLPADFNNAPTITHAMPLAGEGVPVLPSIAFNETFLQETEYRIGENVDDDQEWNQFQVGSQAVRHYTVFVMAASPREREYYKDAVIAIFNAILGPVLNKIGNNVTHRFQSSSSQLVGRSNEPGFYFSEILLEFTGLYSTGIVTTYGPIEVIDSITGVSGIYTESIQA